ncbi:MAG: hypothetical protein WBS33_15495 [Verrucomicrobiia bacterium]
MDQNAGLSTPAPLGFYQQPTPRLPDHGVRQTNAQSVIALFPGRSAALSEPTPIYLDKQSGSQPLQPGVYQTYPWTIILVVPGAETDIRYFAVKPDTNSQMPIIKPHVEVIPKW